MLKTIVSGGQTGVDRAALDIAIQLNVPHGGWCPKGRKAEDGVIDKKYQLQETTSDDYGERTKLNVKDSDGTLIILSSAPIGGTLLTIEEAQRLKKLCLLFNIADGKTPDVIAAWLNYNQIQIVNVAGPRESQSPGIYNAAYQLMLQLFKR